jgi:hypothetical protein
MKQRSLTCVDCGVRFVHHYVSGSPPQRCETCRPIHQARHNAERQKAWRDANPDRAREHWNKSNRKRLADPEFVAARRIRRRELDYGLTQEQFDAMRQAQGDVCAICSNGHVGPGVNLHVDHNHTTGAVRALLCGKCNTLIGLADDSPERLELAAAYLRKHATE